MEFLTLVVSLVGLALLLRKSQPARPAAPIVARPLALESEPLSPADWPEYALGMVGALQLVPQGSDSWKNIITTFQSAAGIPLSGVFDQKTRDTALQAIQQLDASVTASDLPTPEAIQAAPGSMTA